MVTVKELSFSFFPENDLPKHRPNLKDISFPNGIILDINKERIPIIEESVKAAFSHGPGLIGVNFVPLKKTGQILYPSQILDNPQDEFDALLNNRAIATIGQHWEYWTIFQKAIKSGKYDFYHFTSFSTLPFFLDQNNKALVFSVPIEKYIQVKDPHHYNRRLYPINIADGGDFSGLGLPSPKPHVPTISINDRYTDVPYTEIKVSPKIIRKMWECSNKVRSTAQNETRDLILSRYNLYPNAIKKLIDGTLETRHDRLNSFDIVVSPYFLEIPKQKRDGIINQLKIDVNKLFNQQISTSPTVAAVKELVDVLGEMYQEASTNYQF